MKISPKSKNNIKKGLSHILANWAVILGLVITFSGITLSSMIPNIWNSFEFVKRSKAKKQIESVKISSNADYIEDHLGIPIIKYTFNYKEPDTYDAHSNKIIEGTYAIGKKAIYNTDYYLMVLYYSYDDTLLGYILSIKDKECKPEILKDVIDFSYPLSNKNDSIQPEEVCIYNQMSSRNDDAIFYLESHYHHLSTIGLHVGVGYSDLVERDANSIYRLKWLKALQKYVSASITMFGAEDIVLSGDNPEKITTLKKLTAPIHELKPNTIALFDQEDMNGIDFFENEFDTNLGISEQDYLIINY